jgi:hypothetical protein
MNCCSKGLMKMLLKDLAPFVSEDREVFRNEDASPAVVAATLLKSNFAKKFVDDISPNADVIALKKFEACNDRCQDWIFSPERTVDEVVLGHVRNDIHKFFFPHQTEPLIYSFGDLSPQGDVGPGASVRAMGTDFYTKLFSGPLSSTDPILYRLYNNYVSRFPLWARAEEARRTEFGDVLIVEASRMSFVPKTNDESRSIATEPLLNMFFQKGLANILERRLGSHYGINLSDQQHKNRDLAKRGSIDGSLATIDLSSASDTISYRLAKLLIPETMFPYFDALRCKHTVVRGGMQVELHMISTMGNAFTFPLQTLIFSSIVRACASVFDIPISFRANDPNSNWGVNGDDIIVPTKLARIVSHYLHLFGFMVNKLKSFDEGWFRESCGGDYFHGFDVRSVYLKRLKNQQDFYSLINLLNMWSAKTGIFLPTIIRYLKSQVRYLKVPPWDPIETGIRVPHQLAPRKFDSNGSYQYFRLEKKPISLFLREKRDKLGEWIVGGGARKRVFNYEGLFMAFLRGDLRDHRIPIRGTDGILKVRACKSPNWEFSGGVDDDIYAHRQRWNSAVLFNLEID